MEKIVLFDTSIGSRNLGDFIINLSIRKEMDFLLGNHFVINLPTHIPAMSHFQKFEAMFGNAYLNEICDAKYKFLCGTNLIKSSLLKIHKDWMIDFTDTKLYHGAVAVGCGMGYNSKKCDLYTKQIYKKIFSSEYIHAARDQQTKEFLDDLGLKAINTGCPSIWQLTPEVCGKIPRKKNRSVVFTLTDYMKDPVSDRKMISILQNQYENICFWPQGLNDTEYIMSLDADLSSVKFLPPNLGSYEKLLDSGVDYVGTRLHGGIFAMQHHCRTIIIIVDNRAREMNRSFHLNAIERENIAEELPDLINKERGTELTVDFDLIRTWKEQFR